MALRNNFEVTKKFLITKFDCISDDLFTIQTSLIWFYEIQIHGWAYCDMYEIVAKKVSRAITLHILSRSIPTSSLRYVTLSESRSMLSK